MDGWHDAFVGFGFLFYARCSSLPIVRFLLFMKKNWLAMKGNFYAKGWLMDGNTKNE